MLTIRLDHEQMEQLADMVAKKIEILPEERIELMTPEQICKIFGVTKATLHSWKEKGEIPFYQIGGVIRYDLNKLLKIKETKRKR